MTLYLACEAHGRLMRRGDGYWECVGFDGEAAGRCTAGPVPASAAGRLFSGETYWPGVQVRDEAGNVTGLQPARSPAAERVRELVIQLLRNNPFA